MTDVSITAGNVVAGSNATKERGYAGAAVTAGQVVYRDASTGKYHPADNDNATAAVRQPRGIALNGAANNQPLEVQTDGDITIGGTLVAGSAYYLSDTAGGICPVADVITGQYVGLIGLAKSTSVLTLKIAYSGVVIA